MASNPQKASGTKASSKPKPQMTKKELSENELAKVSGGFNPQPEPPGRR
jgi:bacteriocin-like protein